MSFPLRFTTGELKVASWKYVDVSRRGIKALAFSDSPLIRIRPSSRENWVHQESCGIMFVSSFKTTRTSRRFFLERGSTRFFNSFSRLRFFSTAFTCLERSEIWARNSLYCTLAWMSGFVRTALPKRTTIER